jgi:hypothetical protein
MKKINIIILIILALAIGLVAGFYFSGSAKTCLLAPNKKVAVEKGYAMAILLLKVGARRGKNWLKPICLIRDFLIL